MRLIRKKRTELLPGENIIKRQAEKIDCLQKENVELKERLTGYEKQEKEIVDAVVFAKRKQEEYLADLRVRYALENERLRRFCEKMDCYKSREELLRAYDESFLAIKQAREELERVLREDLGAGASDYLTERKRIGDEEIPLPACQSSDDEGAAFATEEKLRELLSQV